MASRRRLLATTAAVAVPTVSGCTGGNGGSEGDGDTVVETAEVSMTGSQFEPRNIHVDAGTEVSWTNDDGVEHTVTSASDNWSKDTTVPAGGEATHSFDGGGVYDVYCTIHGVDDLSGMSMKVGVGDATIADPLGGGGNGGGAY